MPGKSFHDLNQAVEILCFNVRNCENVETRSLSKNAREATGAVYASLNEVEALLDEMTYPQRTKYLLYDNPLTGPVYVTDDGVPEKEYKAALDEFRSIARSMPSILLEQKYLLPAVLLRLEEFPKKHFWLQWVEEQECQAAWREIQEASFHRDMERHFAKAPVE